MYKGKTLGIVFPTFNEEESIVQAIKDFSSHNCVDEVLVVDNNSSDLTKMLAIAAGAKCISESIQGYGSASISGLKNSQQDLVVIVEPDGTFSSKDLDVLLPYSEFNDVVFGSRTSKCLIWDHAFMPYWVRFGNLICAKMIEFLWGGPSLSDVGCTYKLFHRNSIETFINKLTVTGSHFSPHLMITCLESRLKCIEIPINYYPRIGASKITGGNVISTIRLGIFMFFYIIFAKAKNILNTLL